MSRVGTAFLNLGKWLDGENPGSGPQDTTAGDGLNGDKNKIDIALGTGHNADGSHKAAVIDAANLAPTCVDGSSLEQNATTKKLNIKALGVATAMLADDAVTKAKIAADAAGSGLKQNIDGSLSPDVDGTTIQVNGSGKIALVASSPVNTIAIPFAFSGAGNIGSSLGEVIMSGSIGIPVPAGTVTNIKVVSMGGTVYEATPSGGISVGNNSTLRMFDDGTGIIMLYKNGTTTNVGVNIGSDYAAFAVVYMTLT